MTENCVGTFSEFSMTSTTTMIERLSGCLDTGDLSAWEEWVRAIAGRAREAREDVRLGGDE